MRSKLTFALIISAALALLMIGTSSARTELNRHYCPSTVKPFAHSVWDASNWKRGAPKASTLKAWRHKLSCANPSARHNMKTVWRNFKEQYYNYRRYRLNDEYYGCTSYGGCKYYAIPVYIVECESGGRFHDPSAPNGAYSLLTGPLQNVPTWETWRPSWATGYSAPYQAPVIAQDEAAHDLWVAYGSEPWECA